MKTNGFFGIVAALLALCLLLAGCVGAQSEKTPAPEGGETPTPAGGTPEPASPTPAPEQGPESAQTPEIPEALRPLAEAAKVLVVVRSAEELVEAIRPDTAILVEPGDYNLSEYLEAAWAQGGEEWNAMKRHHYVQLEDCFDGVMLKITGVDGLSIFGRGETADTEIVVEPRYADVLKFEDCSDLTLARLTLGHTETGECVGSVLHLEDCRNVVLRDVDLYGCGVHGVQAGETQDLYVYDSVIRDCSFGPLDLEYMLGDVLLENCTLTGSGGAVFLGSCERANIVFRGCTFGERESNSLYFRDDVVTEDCTWSEITEYPDYSDDPDGDFALEGDLAPVRFDALVLADTAWIGVSMYNFDSGEETALPLRREDGDTDVILRLSADGSGALEGLEAQALSLRWEMEEDSDYSALVAMQGEYAETGHLSLFAERGEGEHPLWMELWLGELSIRFQALEF